MNLALILLYFVPTLVAISRKKNAKAVFIVNLFFGWTIIVWFILIFVSIL